jgi:hypothetical protein
MPNNAGTQALIANTFGLPSGKQFSCPGATSVCELICYAGKLEKVFTSVRTALTHNWELLKDASQPEMVSLLSETVDAFRADTVKRGAELLFRIHWDGDFFSLDYATAWREVIEANADIQFWVYTRSDFAVYILLGLDNLGLYFSTDSANKELGAQLARDTGVKLAYLADTFAEGKADMREMNRNGKAGVPCPENNRKVAMIDADGSACVKCGQCIFARNDILFSATKS